MLYSVALAILGELMALAGIALWSVPLALIIAGIQCVALGLLRDESVRKRAATMVRRDNP